MYAAISADSPAPNTLHGAPASPTTSQGALASPHVTTSPVAEEAVVESPPPSTPIKHLPSPIEPNTPGASPSSARTQTVTTLFPEDMVKHYVTGKKYSPVFIRGHVLVVVFHDVRNSVVDIVDLTRGQPGTGSTTRRSLSEVRAYGPNNSWIILQFWHLLESLSGDATYPLVRFRFHVAYPYRVTLSVSSMRCGFTNTLHKHTIFIGMYEHRALAGSPKNWV